MEVAVIDWKSIDTRFVKDELYENINAPQWVDLNAPIDSVDDEAWFCRPDCDHPKKVEDFFKDRTPTPKTMAGQIPPLGDRNRRDATLKKRGQAQQPLLSSNKDSRLDKKFVEDSENKNPNFSTPPNCKSHRFMKETIKSSAEKRTVDDASLRKEQTPSLRRTLSARNLFGGGEILNKITEFCNELKKMATRAKEKEITENDPVLVNKQDGREFSGDELIDKDDQEKERTPLLEIAKTKTASLVEKSNFQEKQRRKKPHLTRRCDDAENTPISIDVNKTKRTEEQSLLQIRTCPPTPQCFSATRGQPTNATPPKVFSSKPLGRGVLQELAQGKKEEKKECEANNKNHDIRGKQASMIADKEARTLDVFWFLKPCTLSS